MEKEQSTHETYHEQYLRRERIKKQVAAGILWTVGTLVVLAILTVLVILLCMLPWKAVLTVVVISAVFWSVCWALETLE